MITILQWPAMSRYDQVRIRLKDGVVIESEQVRRALGDAGRPLSVDDLQRKFFDCLEAGRPELDAGGLFNDLQRIERLPSCRRTVRARSELHSSITTAIRVT